MRYLASQSIPVTFWNRTPTKAQEQLEGHLHGDLNVQSFSLDQLDESLKPGDTVVSMLPAGMHPTIAEHCLRNRAHLITASYLSPDIRKLDAQVRGENLCFVNEIGLDPGLDHFLAYDAVSAFKSTPHWHHNTTKVEFESLCGGLSEKPTEFAYRFSWSPVGVLKALKTPSVFIREGTQHNTPQPWTETFGLNLENEAFEAYPNRDSLPFIEEYDLDGGQFKLNRFIRGSIRQDGWKTAWESIFEQLPTASDEELTRLGALLWQRHAFKSGERDRVILSVRLTAHSSSLGQWEHHGYLDHVGQATESAMAQLVSLPVAYCVMAVQRGEVSKGVTTAPKTPEFRHRIFSALAQHAAVTFRQKTTFSPV